jgi:precorrin-3B synthase
MRRGACPTIAAPMPTGDGLLVRLTPVATIALGDFAALCRAARRCGNGIIEITARGNIQVRGLRAETTDAFARSIDVEAIDLGRVAVLTDALAGLNGAADVVTLAATLRAALASHLPAARLSAKASVTIDGGTALHLDAVPADIRLQAYAGGAYHVAVGGAAADAIALGTVSEADAIAVVLRLVNVIVARGPEARAKNIVQSDGAAIFADVVRELVSPAQQVALRAKAQSIGQHALRDGSVAVGLGFAFGHATANALEQLVGAALQAGAEGLRTAPQRCLLVVGVPPARVAAVVAAARRLGFVTNEDDPRLHVAACAGAPLCASGEIATRTLAPDVATAAARLLDGTVAIHLSGCTKGCAHRAAAALTIVGDRNTCRIILDGAATDTAVAEVPANDLPERLAGLAREIEGVQAPGQAASVALARLGRARIAQILEAR